MAKSSAESAENLEATPDEPVTVQTLRDALNDLQMSVEGLASAKTKYREADDAVRVAVAQRDGFNDAVIEANKQLAERSNRLNVVISDYVNNV